jgi:transposase-like protein
LGLIALIELCGTGRTISLKRNQTRRRWNHRRVAVDEKRVEVDGETKWLYAAIDTDTKCILDIDVYSRRGTGPAAAFLHRLTEAHELDDAEFLVDGMSYLTALARHNPNSHLDDNGRNYIGKWFQTVIMRIDRFHSIWMRGSASAAAG